MVYNDKYIEHLDEISNYIDDLPLTKDISILITGSTGLIGSALVDIILYFNKKSNINVKLYCTSRNIEKIKKRFSIHEFNKNLTFIEYDVKNKLELNINIDYVIHAASNAQPKYYVEQPVETMQANFIGMTNLLEFSLKNNVKRILYVSSSEVYGNDIGTEAILENDYGYVDILDSRSAYPSSKRATETLCKAYIDQYDMDIVIARPGHVYGPNFSNKDSRAFAQFITNVMNGEDIVLKSNGQQLRSYIHSFDVATALLFILFKGETGHAYNVSNKYSNVSIRQFAHTIANLTGNKLVFQNPNDKELKGFNVMQNSQLDSSNLEKLGWKPRFDLFNGLRVTLQAMDVQTYE